MTEPSPPGVRAPLQLLQGSELFRNVAPDALDALVPLMQAREVERGAIVVHEGDTGDEMFLVASGRLEVTRESGDRTLRLGNLGPGDVFGEMALLRGGPRTATVIAAEPTCLWVLARGSLDRAFTAAPELRARLRDIARRRDIANALKALQ